ncbi:hypothetical protein [Streptomyces werraensis]|uniref:hypothetical protein n=1 Tax=Streptomyces werraensis TaxID=68284 RepID=UPI00341CC65F
MSKAKRKARAVASPLELQRKESQGRAQGGSKRLAPEPLTATGKRLKAESLSGANVPARVVERMGGTTRNARTSLDDSGPKMRPKRKARNIGGEAAAAGITGRAYASKGDGIKRLSDDAIRANRAAYFARTAASRKAAPVAAPAAPSPSPVDIARKEYAHAIGQARARAAAGDIAGSEAWMDAARKARRIFRNK